MQNKQHQPVRPISPVAGYIGGKRQLAKRLVSIINATPHTLYAEPFVGMGGVFFRRDHTSSSRSGLVTLNTRRQAGISKVCRRWLPPTDCQSLCEAAMSGNRGTASGVCRPERIAAMSAAGSSPQWGRPWQISGEVTQRRSLWPHDPCGDVQICPLGGHRAASPNWLDGGRRSRPDAWALERSDVAVRLSSIILFSKRKFDDVYVDFSCKFITVMR